jgi:hypothetical protein
MARQSWEVPRSDIRLSGHRIAGLLAFLQPRAEKKEKVFATPNSVYGVKPAAAGTTKKKESD